MTDRFDTIVCVHLKVQCPCARRSKFATYEWPDGEYRVLPFGYKLPRAALLSAAWAKWFSGVSPLGRPLCWILQTKKRLLIVDSAVAAAAGSFQLVVYCIRCGDEMRLKLI